jgi:hypothetical protein
MVATKGIVMVKIKTIQHFNPVWRYKANFIIGAKSNYPISGYDFVWEQLWGRQILKFRFEICCIPFFIYDISLGDEVITDTKYIINEVVKPSGHYTYRVWFGGSPEPNIHEIVINELKNCNCLIEEYSDNLIGIDAFADDAQIVANILYEKEKGGLLNYETGKTAK